jgi:hypothetical protein
MVTGGFSFGHFNRIAAPAAQLMTRRGRVRGGLDARNLRRERRLWVAIMLATVAARRHPAGGFLFGLMF